MVVPARKSRFWFINYWAWDQLALTAANEIWCQRLPREITNASLATIRIIVQSAKKRESSQPLFAVAYMWPKKLWWCSWYKKFSNLVWSKKFFFYFTLRSSSSTSWFPSASFFYIFDRDLILLKSGKRQFQSCFRKLSYCNQTCWDASCQSIDEEEEATSGNYRLSTKHHVL